ncbi:MAG: Rrf2 family transcriptional regulator [Pseudomonadota bacterium]
MRLSQASDFALRILMRLAKQDQPETVDSISAELGLVKSHVMKIVAKLAKAGLIETTRGRTGGISLGRPAREISVGAVVRLIEPDFAIVECMRDGADKCTFLPDCRLRGTMARAKLSFLKTLDDEFLDALVIA